MEEEYVRIWKKHKITHAEFSFDCGNDHMGCTDITFYKGDKVIKEKWGLSSYLSHDIFQEVEFYEASNGHYIGEHGIVTIKLNEEEDGFEYDKSSKSIYNEIESETVRCKITKKQAQFLEEYVSDMSGGEDGGEVNYKKDFILTEEMEEMIDKLHEVFLERVEKWTSKLLKNYWNIEEIEDESERYEIEDVTITEENGKFYVKLNAQCGVYSEEL